MKGRESPEIYPDLIYVIFMLVVFLFIGNLSKMRIITLKFIVSFNLAYIADCTNMSANFEYFFKNSCSLRYKHFQDAKEIIKCDRMRELNPLCNRSIVVKYFELKPYAFNNKSDVTAGLLPGKFISFAKYTPKFRIK